MKKRNSIRRLESWRRFNKKRRLDPTYIKYMEDYRRENRERISKKQLEYKQKNKRKISIQHNKYTLSRYHNDPEYRLAATIRVRIRQGIREGKRSARTEMLLGCSFIDLKKYLEAQFCDGMSWNNHGNWHIDHKKPLITFDLKKESEQKKAFHFSNLQPLWASDNLRKNRYG